MPLLRIRADSPAGRADDIRFVTLDEWRRLRGGATGPGGRLGLRLASEETLDAIGDEIAGDLDRFAAIAIVFPRFTDGRPYTTARLLRERHGYRGEIRAVGEVLRDQLLFMRRCGFDAFELAEGADVEGLEAALREISVVYQPAADGRRPVHWPPRRTDGAAVAANWAY